MTAGMRGESRLRTRLRARLISRLGEDQAVLNNLSLSGCCLELGSFAVRGEVVVKWLIYDAFGEVVWHSPDRIGIRFEKDIPYDWIIATRNAIESASDTWITREAAKAWAEGKRFI